MLTSPSSRVSARAVLDSARDAATTQNMTRFIANLLVNE
jgi:hypothetical protein